MRYSCFLTIVATIAGLSGASAQTPAADPSAKLREVLPADVADRVIMKVQEARARELPAQELENRALMLASQNVPAAKIEFAVNEQTDRMQKAKDAIEQARSRRSSDDEIEAGAQAIGKGVDGAQVSALAKGAPSGRSLAVPLLVIGSLVDRGLPSDEALQRVQLKLQQRATDRELQQMPESAQGQKPVETGKDLADGKRPAGVGKPATAGAPASVPRNAGASAAGRSRRP